jgi:hypothetical protein
VGVLRVCNVNLPKFSGKPLYNNYSIGLKMRYYDEDTMNAREFRVY